MTVNSINVVEAANEARKTAAQAQTKSQDNKDEENKSQDNKDAEEQSQDKKDIEEQPQNKSQQSESPVTPNYDQFLDLYKTVDEGDSMTPIEGTYCRKDGSCVVIAGNSIAPSAGRVHYRRPMTEHPSHITYIPQIWEAQIWWMETRRR